MLSILIFIILLIIVGYGGYFGGLVYRFYLEG